MGEGNVEHNRQKYENMNLEYSKSMNTFRFLFGLTLSEMILYHADKLSQTLQSPDLSSLEGREIVMLTVTTLKYLHSDDLFWKKVERKQVGFDVEEVQIPRKRKKLQRYQVGNSEPEFHSKPIDVYKQAYFEAIDLNTHSITDHFDQEEYQIYLNIEQLLFKTATDQNYEVEFANVTQFYEGDWIVMNCRHS